ncbi:hypothetical protein NCCP28_29980 [Niallia sp. NCCP-28]|nr:hypothetical protein NCCP28_29980 [Niallia sp. NCCP-28]
MVQLTISGGHGKTSLIEVSLYYKIQLIVIVNILEIGIMKKKELNAFLEGIFHERNIHLNLDANDWKYSERYGIDKATVIKKLKEEYEVVHYAGDSEPDSHPAVFADLTFAKDILKDLLKEKGVPFIPFEDFTEIEKYLVDKGLILK